VKFASRPPSDGVILEENVSDNGRVVLAILDYMFGQRRIQVWFDPTGKAPAHQTEIVLEM
jgi:hypothetical protein